LAIDHDHERIRIVTEDGSNREDRFDPITTKVFTSTNNGLSWTATQSNDLMVSDFWLRSSSFFPLKYENIYDANIFVKAEETIPTSFYPASKRINFIPRDDAGAFSINISQFTDDNSALFQGLANLGNGRLVIPYTKFFGLDPRVNGHVGDNYRSFLYDSSKDQYTETGFLRSDDYGQSWQEVSSFKTKADENSTGLERLFIRVPGDDGYDQSANISIHEANLRALNFFSGFVDIEAIPMKDEEVGIVK